MTPSADVRERESAGAARTAIGLDIGGTKIAGAVVTGNGRVLHHVEAPTPPADADGATVEVLRRMAVSLREGHPAAEAIGAGAAGMVEWPSGRIRWAPNNGYRGLALRDLLETETGLPAVVDNDANAAAWAEARHGAASGHQDVAVLTVGTGIGAGVILGGRLHRGRAGLAGEVGHIIVAPDGDPCGCGNVGCLEAMASGAALGKAGQAAALREPAGMLARISAEAGAVTGRTVSEAAARGDRTSLQLIHRVGHWLGIGIASVVNLLDVELVVVGGGLAEGGDLLLGPARESFQRFVFGRGHRVLPPVVPAHFGPDAGVVGAASLALSLCREDVRARAQP